MLSFSARHLIIYLEVDHFLLVSKVSSAHSSNASIGVALIHPVIILIAACWILSISRSFPLLHDCRTWHPHSKFFYPLTFRVGYQALKLIGGKGNMRRKGNEREGRGHPTHPSWNGNIPTLNSPIFCSRVWGGTPLPRMIL